MTKRNQYIKPIERGFFDSTDRLSQIDSMGDPLANLNEIMDWKIFEPVLDLIPKVEAKGPGGRPGFLPIFMFKILVLQSLYGLADEQTQFQILDRKSFHRFLGITEADIVPDQNTIRCFREQLTNSMTAPTASERDATMPADHTGPRPHGGVGGTRTGIKCLHAHYAWFLAGGNDPADVAEMVWLFVWLHDVGPMKRAVREGLQTGAAQ